MGSTSRGAETPACWIVILHLGGESWLGMDSHQELHIGDLAGPRRPLDPAQPVGLLPCLERPLSVVIAELKMREDELGLPTGTLQLLVPWRILPSVAVASQSPYWVDLAVSWFSDMAAEDRDVEVLKALETAEWAPQRVRHRARRLAREAGY